MAGANMTRSQQTVNGRTEDRRLQTVRQQFASVVLGMRSTVWTERLDGTHVSPVDGFVVMKTTGVGM